MLIRFVVSNFLSFDKETEFNMLEAKSLKTHKEHLYPIRKGVNVLKASAIYGANGAGKSNLIKAIDELKWCIRMGRITHNIQQSKFRINKENLELPTTLEIEFSINGQVYTYGLKYESKLILEEWLYSTGQGTPKMIFERTHSEERNLPEIKISDKISRDEKFKLLISLMEENLLKPDELLISKNQNLKIPQIEDVLNWFKNKLVIIYPHSKESISQSFHNSNSFGEFANEVLGSFSLGIDSLEVSIDSFENYLRERYGGSETMVKMYISKLEKGEKMVNNRFGPSVFIYKENNEYKIKKVHTKHQTQIFEIIEESNGTQRLMDFLPVLYGLINDDITYIVDEIDASLHPSMLHTLIRKIMFDNKTKGQLIFTTHESSLLDCKIFRTDEIWFAEKQNHITRLYTLNEFKPRADLDIEKGYLNGRFGAIPFLSKLDDLNWHD